MIEYGMSSLDKGFGWMGDTVWDYPQYRQSGHYQVQDKGNADDTVAEMDLLLTGGRLTTTAIAKAAYNGADEGKKFKAALQAIVLSPEFHTIGNPLPAGKRSAPPTLAPATASSS